MKNNNKNSLIIGEKKQGQKITVRYLLSAGRSDGGRNIIQKYRYLPQINREEIDIYFRKATDEN